MSEKRGVGKGGKHNYEELRIRCLHYLHTNRNNHGERTLSKIMRRLGLSHSAAFNKMMYYLIGAKLVQEDLVGSTWLFSITDKGIMFLEQLKLDKEEK